MLESGLHVGPRPRRLAGDSMGRVINLASVEEKLTALHVQMIFDTQHLALIVESLDGRGRMTTGDGPQGSVLNDLEVIDRVFERSTQWVPHRGSEAENRLNQRPVGQHPVLQAKTPIGSHDCFEDRQAAATFLLSKVDMGSEGV